MLARTSKFRRAAPRLIALLLGVSAVNAADLPQGGAVEARQLPSRLPDAAAGRFAGASHRALVVAGGMADDGSVTKRVHVLTDLDADEWVDFALDAGLAHGASAWMGDKMILAGGLGEEGISPRVLTLEWLDGKLVQGTLPNLPRPLMMAGAGVVDGALYMVGGLEEIDADAASRRVYRLDLGAEDPAWEEHPELPGPGRIQPAVIGFYSELHVFGGFKVTGAQAAALDDGWAYRTEPLDGTTRTGWRPLKTLPVPLAAAAVYQTGQTHAALVGGYTGSIPRADLLAAGVHGQATDGVYVFHNVTDTWVALDALAEGLGGAKAVPVNGQTVLVGGASGDRDDGAALWQFAIEKKVRRLVVGDYTVMLIYFCLMAWIGVYFARKQDSSEEFSLGNRNVRWWAAAISMFATGASSISFMAIPAQTFRTNLVWFTPVLFLVPLYFLQAYILYPLLRRLNLTSTYEYLERRFHPSLRFLASLQCITFQMLGRMSVVLLLPALAISAVTGLDVYVSVLVMGLLTTVYTAFGGFEAVIWTDVTQGVLMLGGACLMIVLAISGLPGGFGEFIETGQAFHRFDMAIFSLDYTLPIIWISILALIMQNLAFASDQPMVQRVFATPLKDVRRLAGMFIFCSIAIAAAVNFAGLSIFAYFHAHPEMLDPTMSNDQVIPLYIVQRLPVGIAGLIIAALFAASMSTLSSSMNSVATLISEDFYRRFVPQSTDRSRLLLMKFGSLFVGVFGTGVAYYMARMDLRSMFQTWNEICALLGGGFIGIYILGMFTRRTSSLGAVVGALGSIVTTILVKQYSDLHWVFYAPAAVLSCLVIGYATSLVLPSRRVKDFSGLTVFDMQRGPLEEDRSNVDHPTSNAER